MNRWWGKTKGVGVHNRCLLWKGEAMSVDPFQFVKGVRKGLRRLSEKLEKTKNPNLREMGKRLSEIGTKMSEKFDVNPTTCSTAKGDWRKGSMNRWWGKIKRGKKDEDQS